MSTIKYITVIALDGSRVIDNVGETVVKQFPSTHLFYPKQFVGEQKTLTPKELPDWNKLKKRK